VADEQDRAEALDDDVVDDDADFDEEPAGDYPPDVLQGANQYGVTEAEESVDEPLEERIAREEPDPVLEALEEEAELREDRIDGDPLGGTLVEPLEPDDDPFLDADLVIQDDLSPEEAAIHLEEE